MATYPHLFRLMVTSETSTSASQSMLSAAGCSYVSGLAILANPRAISKTIVVDVQLYLGSDNQDSLIGSLRYFNSANLTFDDGPNLYVIQATVSSILLSSSTSKT
jgi:hypothetical protein